MQQPPRIPNKSDAKTSPPVTKEETAEDEPNNGPDKKIQQNNLKQREGKDANNLL